ncbi:hypothetical protein CHH83_21130 [Bacillus sp. 7586-K]|uniref:Spo0B C-terminal domain-containing protein n=1 Tax=Metabacillus niabensis TaxID=324854 RepID=UPI000BA55FEB|nr:hypothetical protein CHH83_21130 [Bacillus sp. 7586-K]
MKNKNSEWNVVDLLSHSRHDWMNKLQLIKGNLSLQKFDRVHEIIEEVIIESQQESKLCNLKMSAFASYLMTFNWKQHHFQLEYEILGDVLSLEEYDMAVSQWTKSLLETIDQLAEITHDNHLMITIDIGSNEDDVRFFFDFNGIIKETETLISWLSKHHEKINVKEFEVNTYEVAIVVSLGT